MSLLAFVKKGAIIPVITSETGNSIKTISYFPSNSAVAKPTTVFAMLDINPLLSVSVCWKI